MTSPADGLRKITRNCVCMATFKLAWLLAPVRAKGGEHRPSAQRVSSLSATNAGRGKQAGETELEHYSCLRLLIRVTVAVMNFINQIITQSPERSKRMPAAGGSSNADCTSQRREVQEETCGSLLLQVFKSENQHSCSFAFSLRVTSPTQAAA